MKIENLIYLFLAVLVSMIVFNIVCIFVFSFQDRRLNKNNNRFAELIRKQMETGIDDKHKKYMYRKLKNIDKETGTAGSLFSLYYQEIQSVLYDE